METQTYGCDYKVDKLLLKKDVKLLYFLFFTFYPKCNE